MKILKILVMAGTLANTSLYADTGDILQKGEKRLTQNQEAQDSVSNIHEKTQDLVESFQALLKVVDGLGVYNQILSNQISNQEVEISALNQSISDAAVIERQILPLLSRMLDGLDIFISLDIPFLLKERHQRLDELRKLMTRSGLKNAEKTRRVFEAYQIENEYGSSIEAYKGKLDINSKTFDVDYLRVGRIAFVYRSVGSEYYGYWDIQKNQWLPLEDSIFKRDIDKGIKMARQELAPEFFTIPVLNRRGKQ